MYMILFSMVSCLIFLTGSTKNNIMSYTLPMEYDDFAAKDPSFVDNWVYDKV